MSDFGQSLKNAREALGISLNDIARETRISTRFLEAIENEQFHLLPGGLFNRGFIRAYAEHVGIDPNQALAEYDRLVRPREVEVTATSVPEERPRVSLGLYPIAVAALILLLIGFYALTRSDPNSVSTTAPAPAATEEAPPVSPPSPSPSPVIGVAPEPAPPQTPAAPEQLAIEVDVHELVWIRVAADGTPPVEMILQPGTSRRFTAQTSISLTIGNAGGVTLKVNDREIPMLGKSGQVRAFLITPENADRIS